MKTYKALLSTYRTEIKNGSFRGNLFRILVFAPIGVFLFILFEVALTDALHTTLIALTAGYVLAMAPFLWFFNGDGPFGGDEEGGSYFSFSFGSGEETSSSQDDFCHHSSSDFSGGDSCGDSD